MLILAEDHTHARRVEEVRRDFVANVSHELKTPVGAMTLLAEATEEAADDPEAVRRFAGRLKTEASRLTRLVMQIIELSRLQDDELVEPAVPVPVDAVVARAVETNEVEAKAKDIEVAWQGRHDLMVPFSHGEWLVEHVPRARSRLRPEQGHLSLAVGSIGEIFDDLLEAAGTASETS